MAAAILILSALTILTAGCGDRETGSSGEPVWLTVGDRNIGETEARYFLFTSANIMRQNLPSIGWDDYIEGVAASEFVRNEAVDAMKLYHAINLKAVELSATLSEQQQTDLENLWQDRINHHGSEEAFFAYLESENVTPELFRYIIETGILYENVWEAVFGDSAIEGEDAFSEFSRLVDEWAGDVPYHLGDEFLNVDIRELYENFRTDR